MEDNIINLDTLRNVVASAAILPGNTPVYSPNGKPFKNIIVTEDSVIFI